MSQRLNRKFNWLNAYKHSSERLYFMSLYTKTSMKKVLMTGLLGIILCLTGFSQTGKIGINTTAPAAVLHVKDSSVLFSGPAVLPSPAGKPPVSGPGTRMMWYSDKAAFRAGTVTGNQWDKDSTGLYSFGVGYNPVAKGSRSMAMGYDVRAVGTHSLSVGRETLANNTGDCSIGAYSTASGGFSIALGTYAEATDIYAVSIGFQTVASNDRSVAIGNTAIASGNSAVALGRNDATGNNSTAIGLNSTAVGATSFSTGNDTRAVGNLSFSSGLSTVARSYASAVFGRYNDSTATYTNTWTDTDPLFVVGNGLSNTDRKNALTILKNGKTGLGTSTPVNMLLIRGDNDSFDGPILGLSGIGADQTESGRIRFYEGNSSYNLRGAYIHLDGSANKFHIGVHNTSDNIVTNDHNVISIDRSTGNVGIETVSPSYVLEVNGSAGKPGGGSWENSSDARLKQDIKPYTDGLESVIAIRPVTYHYNTLSGFDTQKEYVGIIAQELEQVAPYMVNTSGKVYPDGSTGYLTVDNSAMVYMLINAVKEQQAIIEKQQATIDMLLKRIEKIEAGHQPVVNSGE